MFLHEHRPNKGGRNNTPRNKQGTNTRTKKHDKTHRKKILY